jgi:hypothetical protein
MMAKIGSHSFVIPAQAGIQKILLNRLDSPALIMQGQVCKPGMTALDVVEELKLLPQS